MSNFLVHTLVNTLAYIAFSLVLVLPVSWGDWAWMVLFGTVFDIDHVPYFLVHTRPLTLQNLKDRIKTDYAGQVPHFYACHTLEFQILLLCIHTVLGGTSLTLWLLAGWAAHLVTDVVAYLRHYKGLQPWAKFWSMGYYFTKMRKQLVSKSNNF